MIPVIDATHYALIHHVVAPRSSRRAVAATHDPREVDDHARLTFSDGEVPVDPAHASETHVRLETAEMQALQYSQAYEDMLVNLSSQAPLPVVLDGIDSVASTLAIPLQDELLAAYSAGHSQEVTNVVAGTYLHDELAVQHAAHVGKQEGAVDTVT